MPISRSEFYKLPKERPLREQIIKERLEALAGSKEKFEYYVGSYYEREMDFPKSSYHFHKRVLEIIRKGRYEELFTNMYFLDLVYATLATWGLDRMDGKARLVDFDIFRKSIEDNSTILQELSKFKLNMINGDDEERIKNKLAILYENLKVMESKAKLVGVSKALHHLLPDLVPPVDRKYTLKFFYNRSDYKEKEGKEMFLEIFGAFYEICKRINLTEKDLRREWDTSIPKLIDNAIIGYVSKELTAKR
jgi:hypothetical protein